MSEDANMDVALAPAAASAAATGLASSASVGLPPDIVAMVEGEQALADLQAALKAREKEVEKLKLEKQGFVSDRDAAVSTANQLRTQLGTLQSTLLQSNAEMTVLQSRTEAADREKRQLLDEISHAQDKAQQSSKSENGWRQKASEWSQKVARLEVEVSELKMRTNSAEFTSQRNTQILNNVREENKALAKAATDVEARFSQYRASTQSELSDLELANETIQTRLSSAETKHSSLLRTFEEQSRRLADAHANIANLTSNAASQKMSYRREFDRLMEEIRLLERRSDEARAAVADREAELERHSEDMAERERMWEERVEREEKGRKIAEKRADDLKVTLQQLTSSAGDGSIDVSRAASLASSQRASGKSYTQFYTDFIKSEQDLQEKEQEVQRLTALVEEISQDIVEQRPILNQLRSEHNEAVERANELAGELSTAIASREKFENRVKVLEAASTHHTEEVASLESQLLDRDAQCKSLVRELAIRDDPTLAYVAFNATSEIKEGDPITDRLLLFKSLPALQEQNGKLLKIVRALQARLSDRETKRATAEDNGALDEAADTITTLHTKLVERQNVITDLQAKIMEITRERDVFSRLLSRGEGLRWPNGASSSNGPVEDSSAEAISSLQAELDVVRKKADEDVTEAKKLARQKSEEAGNSEVERAKAEAKATMLSEQNRLLSETHAHQKQENTTLEAQVRQLQSQISQVQQERRKALDEVAMHQTAEGRLRDEASQLRAGKEQWESMQTRMQADFTIVQQERANLQHLIDNLKGINSESGRTRTEELTRLEKRIEELQREAVALRAQADQAREATRVAEAKVVAADARVASETAGIRTELTAALALVESKTAELAALNQQVDSNTAEITSLNQQIADSRRIGLKWQRKGIALEEAAIAHQDAITAKETEITTLKKQLEEAQGKVTEAEQKAAEAEKKAAEAEKKAAEAEQTAATKDGAIQKLQTELTQAQAAAAAASTAAPATPAASPAAVPVAAPAVDTAQLTALQAERDNLQQRLSQAEKELETVKASVSEAAASTPAAPSPAAAVASGAGTPAAPAAADSELQAKITELTEKLAEEEKRYETNVTKVNKVNMGLNNRAKALQAERAVVDARIVELETEVADLKAKLEAATAVSAGGGDQAAVDAAVQAAVVKREQELAAEHTKALADASSKPDDAALQAAVAAKEAELKATFDKQLAEAKAAAATGEATPEEAAKVTELAAKIKALERQLRTAEITRKTLERQKNNFETKLKNLESGGTAAPAAGSTSAASPAATTAPAAGTPALSAAASAFKPSIPVAVAKSGLPVKPTPVATNVASTTSPPTPSETTPAQASAARGGAARGRGRGAATAIRGRGIAPARAGVLNAVNATLATETGTKRPAPDDDAAPTTGNDILARLQAGTPAAGAGADAPGVVTRAAKRPRGGAGGPPARGRGTGRRASGTGGEGA